MCHRAPLPKGEARGMRFRRGICRGRVGAISRLPLMRELARRKARLRERLPLRPRFRSATSPDKGRLGGCGFGDVFVGNGNFALAENGRLPIPSLGGRGTAASAVVDEGRCPLLQCCGKASLRFPHPSALRAATFPQGKVLRFCPCGKWEAPNTFPWGKGDRRVSGGG